MTKDKRREFLEMIKNFTIKNKEHFDNSESFSILMAGMQKLEDKYCSDKDEECEKPTCAPQIAKLMYVKKFIQEFFKEAYSPRRIDMDDVDVERFIAKINEKIVQLLDKDCFE